jgi:hypothetical protein
MLSVNFADIVSAELIRWEPGEYGVAYKTKDGAEHAERVGKKAEAEALVRQISANDNFLGSLFPRDIAAS